MKNSLASLEKFRQDMTYCLQCGLCLSECPVYKASRLASLTSRGRMRILLSLLDGEITASKRVEEVLNQCLLCEACAKLCPTGMPVGEIMATARSVIKSERGLPLAKKLVLGALAKQNQTGKLARLMAVPAKLVTKESEIGLVPRRMVSNLFPLANLPKFGGKTFLEKYSGVHKPVGLAQGRIGYFVGCMTNLCYQRTGEGVLNYLLKTGYEVVIPKEQGCCGLPAFTSGDLEGAEKQVQENLKVFAKDGLDTVIADCASCVSMWQERGEGLASETYLPVVDVMEFLASQEKLTAELNLSEGSRVGYHAPCHTRGKDVARNAPRKILESAQAYVALENEENCCGGGGSFGCFNSELMAEIQKDKIAEIGKENINILATTCPSCRLYLTAGLAEQNINCSVCHPLELLFEKINL